MADGYPRLERTCDRRVTAKARPRIEARCTGPRRTRRSARGCQQLRPMADACEAHAAPGSADLGHQSDHRVFSEPAGNEQRANASRCASARRRPRDDRRRGWRSGGAAAGEVPAEGGTPIVSGEVEVAPGRQLVEHVLGKPVETVAGRGRRRVAAWIGSDEGFPSTSSPDPVPASFLLVDFIDLRLRGRVLFDADRRPFGAPMSTRARSRTDTLSPADLGPGR